METVSRLKACHVDTLIDGEERCTVCGEGFNKGVHQGERERQDGDEERERDIDGTAGVLIHGKCAVCMTCGAEIVEGANTMVSSAQAFEIKLCVEGTVRCKYYDWDLLGRLKPRCRVCWRANMVARGLGVGEVDAEEMQLLY